MSTYETENTLHNDTDLKCVPVQTSATEASSIDIFENKVKNIMRSSYTMVGIALGRELGWLEELSTGVSFTADQLAKQTQCKERYVKEWLHFMVAGDIIDTDQSGTTFTLPRHHVPSLMSATDDLGMILPHLTLMHTDLVKCFKNEGPSGMDECTLNGIKDRHAIHLTDEVLLCSEFVRKSVNGLGQLLDKGIKVCQVKCTKGPLLLCLASVYPKSNFVGVEENEGSLEKAIHAASHHVHNVEFQVEDLANMSKCLKGNFELVLMYDSLHNVPCPEKCLEEVYQCIKPGGQLVMFDAYTFSNPYLTAANQQTKGTALERYLSSLYRSLPAGMCDGDCRVLGACPGIEDLCKLIKSVQFTLENATVVQHTSKVVLVCRKNE